MTTKKTKTAKATKKPKKTGKKQSSRGLAISSVLAGVAVEVSFGCTVGVSD